MSDWQVGDLAVCVDDKPCPYYGPHPAIAKGRTYTVAEVLPHNGLLLAGINSNSPSRGFAAHMFRKIRPDEQEACEPEFVTLLKRSRVPETASDWLLSVKDLARRLNEQSRRDPREREAGNRLPANQ